MMLKIFILITIVPVLATAAAASTLQCGACTLLVTQFENRIAGADQKKKVAVGSFRVSPDGQQKGLKEIPYARSESHLTEIIENVCDEAKNYKLVVNPITGKSVYVHNDSTYLKGDDSKKMRAQLQNACNDFIDSHEDELLGFLKKEHNEPIKEFCQFELGVCTSVDVSPLPPNDPPKEEKDTMTLDDIPTDEMNDEL